MITPVITVQYWYIDDKDNIQEKHEYAVFEKIQTYKIEKYLIKNKKNTKSHHGMLIMNYHLFIQN